MTDTVNDATAAVRHFNRFYTRQLGLLDEGLLKSGFSLTEARILYDLATSGPLTATRLCAELGLDPGYVSRILKSFETGGLISRLPVMHDGRQVGIALTDAGRAAFAPLDQGSRDQVRAMIGPLSPAGIEELLRAMRAIERLMTGPITPAEPYRLRGPGLGDIGWIIHRQAVLYAAEYGWNQDFEVLLAEIFAGMTKTFDPERERGWIAERGDQIAGSVFVVRASDRVAKLRLLYVEPSARGLGIGRRLVRECIGFAREKGYETMTLWTNDVLLSARRIYREAGFRCVAAEPAPAFGKDLVSETWELALTGVS